MSYEKINLENLMNGGLEERFQYELKSIIGNMQDINTDHKAPREMNIKIKFSMNEERENIRCFAQITSKLAPLKPTGTFLSLAEQNGSMHLFQETSRDIPLFSEEEKKNNEINIKEVINE